MNDTLLGYHPIRIMGSTVPGAIWGYAVLKQTRGKRQRYSLYAETVDVDVRYTRIARDLNRADAGGMLKVLLACASNG